MRRARSTTAMLGLALAATLGLTAAEAQTAAKPSSRCFLSQDWNGWKATEDSRSMYIRVGLKSLYRVDFAGMCPRLQSPGAHLVTRVRGSSWICSPLDLDIKVSDGPPGDIATPCIAKAITPLSAEEAAALPKKLKP